MSRFDALGVPQQGLPNVGQQMLRGSRSSGHIVHGNPSPAVMPVDHD
jgi:hypothetical protein